MPDFGSPNDLIMTHIIESTLGVTPANPVLQRLRVAGETLGPRVMYDESGEINPLYALADLVPVGSEGGGSFPFDFAKSVAFDDILQAVLRGTWTTGVLKGGTVKRSYTIEKSVVAGGGRKYMKFPGSRYMGISLSGSVGSRITGSVDVMSLSGIPSTTSIIGTGSVTEPADTRILSMVDISAFSITGDVTPLIIKSFSLSINNNGRYQQGQGQLASYDIAYGMRDVTFSMDAYFESWEQMDKLLNRGNNNLNLTIGDGTNSYAIRLPRLRYRTNDANASGNNEDMVQSIEGRGLYDPTAGVVSDIMITRTPA
jgi:hypothetical protein